MYEENIKLEIEPIDEVVAPIVPKWIFIVPYRDREQQKSFFIRQMQHVLEDINKDDYVIYFAHQCDNRDFNRGAMKNIGFLAMKQKYPNDYQNITFIFNDVDTMPYTKNFLKYDTTHGNVKHFYGYTFTLGGIVSIKGSDYEKSNGFPNLWAWGYEDNMFQQRVLSCGLHIDRSQFYPMMDKNILQMKDGLERVVNRNEYERFKMNTTDGLQKINELIYHIDEDTKFINITNFKVEAVNNPANNTVHDLRKGNTVFGRPQARMQMRLGGRHAPPAK
jgi:hypothetical protein